MAKDVVDKDYGYKDIMGLLTEDLEVVVGVRAEDGSGYQEGSEGSGATIAEYATYNEFGMGVPERSFLRSTVDENRDAYFDQLAQDIGKAIDKTYKNFDKALNRMGLRAVRDVQKKIRALRDPPNAESTIRRKGSSNPLIDTGTLRNSISHEVRPMGKK